MLLCAGALTVALAPHRAMRRLISVAGREIVGVFQMVLKGFYCASPVSMRHSAGIA